MLDDQCARSRVFVSNDVDLLFAFLADGGHRSVGDENARHALTGAFVLGVNQQGEIGGIREQPPLSRFDGFEEAFAREGIAVQNVEASAVQRERARVAQPRSFSLYSNKSPRAFPSAAGALSSSA